MVTARKRVSAASPPHWCSSGVMSGTTLAPGFRAVAIAALRTSLMGTTIIGLLVVETTGCPITAALVCFPRRALVARARGDDGAGHPCFVATSCQCPVCF